MGWQLAGRSPWEADTLPAELLPLGRLGRSPCGENLPLKPGDGRGRRDTMTTSWRAAESVKPVRRPLSGLGATLPPRDHAARLIV